MNIKILGSGCPSCIKLEEHAKTATLNLGVTASIEKITDFNKIMAYGVMSTPALVVNNKIVSMGRVLSVKEIENLLK